MGLRKFINWRDVLYSQYYYWGEITIFWDFAKRLHYPYFEWNGWVYETLSGNKTQWKSENLNYEILIEDTD